MRCEEFMTRDVLTVQPSASLEEAKSTMRVRGIRHLVVVSDRRVVGVLSDRDVNGRATAKGATVESAMTPHPVTAEPETTVRRAANLMRGRSIGCLPIMEGSRLRGIVTVSDLLDILGRGVERTLPEEKRRKSSRPGGRRGPPHRWDRQLTRVRR